MKIIKPITMTAAMLTSSTVPETTADAAAYNAGTTYALNAQCSVTTGNNIQFYRSLQAGNLNKTPASQPTWWEPSSIGYVPYSAATAYVAGDKCMLVSNHMVYEALAGKTSSVTCSIGAPAVIGWVYHGLAESTPITFTAAVYPGGIVAGTTYYVKNPLADSFNIAATPGGAAITTTGTATTVVAYTNRGISPDVDVAGTGTNWIEYSATNRWKAFDKKLGDQVQKSTNMQFVVTPGVAIEAVSFFNLDADTFDMTYYVAGVDTKTVSTSLISTREIVDAKTYFFNGFLKSTELAYTDLPLGNGGILTVTLTKSTPGEMVGLGEIVFGTTRPLGLTQYGASISITDYSKKETDVFGNYTILERAYSSRMSLDMWLPPAQVDVLKRLLVEIRATPVVWVGSDDPVLESDTYGDSLFASMVIYGFYKSFNIVMESFGSSGCSMEIEGLT